VVTLAPEIITLLALTLRLAATAIPAADIDTSSLATTLTELRLVRLPSVMDTPRATMLALFATIMLAFEILTLLAVTLTAPVVMEPSEIATLPLDNVMESREKSAALWIVTETAGGGGGGPAATDKRE
jgi:hypothetical protein